MKTMIRSAALLSVALCIAGVASAGASASPPSAKASDSTSSDASAGSAPAAQQWEGRRILKEQPKEVAHKLLKEGAVIFNKVKEGDGSTDGSIRALVLFERDADTVLKMLTETERQTEYLPVIDKATTLEKSESGNLDQHELSILFMDLVYRVRHRWDADKHKMWWSLDPTYDNDLRTVEGSWKIYPLSPRQSIGEYRSRVDVGRAVPKFIQDFLTRRDLPKALHSQRKWVNSGGTYRKSS